MYKVLSLEDFENPCFDNLSTASYYNGKSIHCSKDELNQECQPFALYLKSLPAVVITPEILVTRDVACTIAARDLFLPVQDSALKQLVNIWREKGLLEAVKAAAEEDPQQITLVLHWTAVRLLRLWNLVESKTLGNRGLPVLGVDSVADVAATRDYPTALVRCMAWHPQCTRFAVATRDDRIRVFSGSGTSTTAVLRHGAQKLVCCMSWRPYSGRELAAGCQYGVLLWTVELGAASNTLSHAILLEQRNHAPVTSISWHPDGNILASCSLRDSNMIIWDVARESGIPLRRVGGGELCLVNWSPCGSKLFSSTGRTVFRIWDVGVGGPWQTEKWTVPSGRVAAACFGPKLTLFFTTIEDSSTLFSLALEEQIFDGNNGGLFSNNKTATPMVDLKKVIFPSNTGDEEEEISVGGRVVALDCDPTGRYLAIMFKESPIIAIFEIKVGSISSINEVKPLCFVRSFTGDSPSCMQFYKNHNDLKGVAYLTIAWSSGNVQNFPIVDNIPCRPELSTTRVLMSNTFDIAADMTYTSFYKSFEDSNYLNTSY